VRPSAAGWYVGSAFVPSGSGSRNVTNPSGCIAFSNEAVSIDRCRSGKRYGSAWA